MKDIEVGDVVRIVACNSNMVHYVGNIGIVETVDAGWATVAIKSGSSRKVRWFSCDEVAPISWNVEVRRAGVFWHVYSRSMLSGSVNIERTFQSHNAAMDYARSLAISINGWAK